jgi:endonuclease/exonuclease/phosphatase family metal-dependent hydrolase
VVLGDLNVTAQSPHFRRLLSAGALRDAGAGRGWQPTWPVGFPLLGIRIDHALVNAAVRVREYGRGPAIGSDHWPLKIGIEYGI